MIFVIVDSSNVIRRKKRAWRNLRGQVKVDKIIENRKGVGQSDPWIKRTPENIKMVSYRCIKIRVLNE
jgi:hypothetical protein